MQIAKIKLPFVIDEKLFRTNEQYEILRTIFKEENCGCKAGVIQSIMYYQISVNDKLYDLRFNYVYVLEQSNITNTKSPEEYHSTLRDTMKPGVNYDSIRERKDTNAIAESANIVRM